MQEDDNLAVTSLSKPTGKPVWASNTQSLGAFLALQNDANVVIYNKSLKSIWTTYTDPFTNIKDTLYPNDFLPAGESIVSPNKN